MTEQINTEAKIMAAATQIFLEKGKEGARMQDIADRAGLNKALLHYYFRTKDRLYEHVFVEENLKFVKNLFKSIQNTGDIRDFLRSFITNYMDHLAKFSEIVRFVLWEFTRNEHLLGNTLLKALAERGYKQEPFVDIIEEAITKKQIRPIDPAVFMLNLLGACVFPFVAQPIIRKVFPRIDLLSQDFMERRKEETYELFWRGIKLGEEM